MRPRKRRHPPLSADRRRLCAREGYAGMASSPPGCPDVLDLMDCARSPRPLGAGLDEVEAHASGCPICCRRLRQYRDVLATEPD